MMRSNALIALLLSCAALPVGAAGPTTAVMLGDAHGSGEAARWFGNSANGVDGGDRAGTDGAAYRDGGQWKHAPGDRSYTSDSYEKKCDRGIQSPIGYLGTTSAGSGLPLFEKTFNLACAGAGGAVFGRNFRGVSAQIELLSNVAAAHDVKLVVIAAGMPDALLASRLATCMRAWADKHFTTRDDASCILEGGSFPYEVSRSIDYGFRQLRKAVADIRDVISARGASGYRIVLLGVPSPIPGHSGFAYSAGDRRVARCPFNGPDAEWLNNTYIPKVNAMVRAVAEQQAVGFIDPTSAFYGHRLCEAGTRRAEAGAPVSELNAEWVRYFDGLGTVPWDLYQKVNNWRDATSSSNSPSAGDQGRIQESLFPNAFGQKVLGACIRRYLESTSGSNSVECARSGADASSAYVVPLSPGGSINYSIGRAIPDVGKLVVFQAVSGAGQERGRSFRATIVVQHTRLTDLQMTLVSPLGKRYPIDKWSYTAIAQPIHQFEADVPVIAGQWQIEVLDTQAGSTGFLSAWRMHFL